MDKRKPGDAAPSVAAVPSESSVPMLKSADVLASGEVASAELEARETASPAARIGALQTQLETVLGQLDEANQRAQEAMRCEAGALQMIAELEKRFDLLNAEVLAQRRFNEAKAAETASAPGKAEVAVRANAASQIRKAMERIASEIERGAVRDEPDEVVPSNAPPLAEGPTGAGEDAEPGIDWLGGPGSDFGEISGPVPSDWEATLAQVRSLVSGPIIKVDRTVTMELDQNALEALDQAGAAAKASEMLVDMGEDLEGVSVEEEEATRPLAQSTEEAAELAAMAAQVRVERESQEIEEADLELDATESIDVPPKEDLPVDEPAAASEPEPDAEPEAEEPAQAKPRKPAKKAAAKKRGRGKKSS